MSIPSNKSPKLSLDVIKNVLPIYNASPSLLCATSLRFTSFGGFCKCPKALKLCGLFVPLVPCEQQDNKSTGSMYVLAYHKGKMS